MRGVVSTGTAIWVVLLFGMVPLASSEYVSELEFSGLHWHVRETDGRRGPGPNYFSTDERSVRVTGDGELVLSVRPDGEGRWVSAELRSQETTGYGRYAAVVRIPDGGLPSPLVFGFFTYDQRPEYDHREIDMEFAPFEGEDRAGLYASVQPAARAGNSVRADVPPGAQRYYLSFEWAPGEIEVIAHPVDTDGPELRHTFEGDRVPPAGETYLHMNLWLFRGDEPDFADSRAVVVEWVYYAPQSD